MHHPANEEILSAQNFETIPSQGESGWAWRRRANIRDLREEDHQEDDHQEDNFRDHDHREQGNARDLSRIVVEMERRCTNMEMERKDKNKSIVVDMLLSGIGSPFTKRVETTDYPRSSKSLRSWVIPETRILWTTSRIFGLI